MVLMEMSRVIFVYFHPPLLYSTDHLSSFSCPSHQFFIRSSFSSNIKAPDQTQEHMSCGIDNIYNTFLKSNKRAIKRSIQCFTHKTLYCTSYKVKQLFIHRLNYTTQGKSGPFFFAIFWTFESIKVFFIYILFINTT